MKKIIVATDLSVASKNATSYAAALASHINAELTLLSVTPPGLLLDDSMLAPLIITQAEIIEKNKTTLKAEAENLSSFYNINVQPLVVEGDPVNSILNIVKQMNSDLLIVGARGKGNSNAFFGSTTTALLNKGNGPVLIIPETYTYSPIKNIAYASDFSSSTELISHVALFMLAESFNANIDVIHVQTTHFDLTQPHVIEKMNINQLLSKFSHSFHNIKNEKVEAGIKEFLKENESQILTLVARKHNFFEKLFGIENTPTIINKTKIPLLIIQPA